MIEYGQFLLCIVRHELKGYGQYPKIYPIFKTAKEKLYVSNRLSEDYFYYQILDGLAEYIIGNDPSKQDG